MKAVAVLQALLIAPMVAGWRPIVASSPSWIGAKLLTKIDSSQVFYQSQSGMSVAFVNLRPIVPGHVLVAPVRNALKLHQMNEEEVCDLWLSAREIGGKLEAHYKGEALNYAIQDGAAAGQSVPHVHVHILPRRKDDFERNDDVYEELEHHKAFHVPDEGERRNRSKEEMAQEANELRALFNV